MLLDTLPDDRPSRWAAASSLISAWFAKAPRPAEAGFDESDVAAAERRLGIRLPDALREWYASFGGLSDVWNVQERLLPPAELEWEGKRLIIARENQNVVQWFIDAASLDALDPPVLVSDQTDATRQHLAATSISEFALQLLVLNAKFSNRGLFRANGPATDRAVVAVDQSLRRFPFQVLHWPPFPTLLYGDDDIIAEVQARTWIWITARDGEKFESITRLLENAEVEWQEVERPEHSEQATAMRSGEASGVYVETDCCLNCGVPWKEAPEVFEQGEGSCLVKRQPEGATELRRVLRVFQNQDLTCVRYGGSDARILALLEDYDCADQCDHVAPRARAARIVDSEPRPPGLKPLLALAALPSAAGTLSSLVFPPALSGLGWTHAGLSALTLFFCWAALRPRAWAYWGLVGLLLVNALATLAAHFFFGQASLLGGLFLAALAFGIFSHRRWYVRSAER